MCWMLLVVVGYRKKVYMDYLFVELLNLRSVLGVLNVTLLSFLLLIHCMSSAHGLLGTQLFFPEP